MTPTPLSPQGQPSSADLVRILRDELRHLAKTGAKARVEDLLAKWPQAAIPQEGILDLIYQEIVIREELGETPALEEYQQRFPRLNSFLVRQFALHEMLKSDPLSDSEQASEPTVVAEASPGPVVVQELGPGVTIHHYRVEGELGRGGMGVVFRAFDLKHQKVVALKTMQWLEPSALYRFKQEFRTLAGLAHHNLITLYELISDGREWLFSMELVDGVDFLTYVRDARPTTPEASLDLEGDTIEARHAPRIRRLRKSLTQLAQGILALHDAGKLHRDIKPANVLVTKTGRVVLMDFGLAAELDQRGQHESTEAHVLGSIGYMAPEQAASQPVSPASDWYAVGVMLYEALAGRRPFEGKFLEVLQKKQHLDPPSPGSLVSGVPEDLDVLAIELLRRNPAERPSGREVLRRLSETDKETGRQGDEETGKPEPVSVSPCLPVSLSSALRLVGRKPHLEALADAFRAACQGGTVVLQVHGPSGVGKSTLIRSFLDGLVEGAEAVVLAGQCYEQEAVPYKALDSLVDALSRYLIRLSALEAEAVLPRDVQALARVFPVLRRIEAVASAPQRPLDLSDPQEVRRRALSALRELLGRLGDRKPLVLFIDDLQWGDADSAALLVDLLQPPDAPALLLVVSYRSDSGDAKSTAKPADAVCLFVSPAACDCRELTVEPLTMEESRDLASTLLAAMDSAGDPLATAETIARESGGNPFFLIELAQHASTARREGPAASVASPTLLLDDVLWSRIERLPDVARRILEVVAVAGLPLRQTVACQAAGLGSEELTALMQLRAGRFIRSTVPADREEIDAYHNRIRETIVGHLSAASLRRHHRHLARALESSGPVDAELLATHFLGASELAQAGKYFGLAAAQASQALAFDRAAKLYRLALRYRAQEPEAGDVSSSVPPDACPLTPEEERHLRTCLGDALANAGRGAESAREYLTAAASAGPADALELKRRASLQFLISGHVDEGLDTLRAVLSAVGMEMPRTPRRAFWSLILRRVQLYWRGLAYRPRTADEVAPADLARIDICWSAAAGLSVVDTIQGAYFQTRGLLLALDAGEPNHLARALAMEAAHVSIGGGGSQPRTAQLLKAADALAQQVNHPYPRGMVAVAHGIAAAFAGNWRSALSHCDEAEAIFRDSCTGVVWELDSTHRFALWALMFMGQIPEMARRVPLLRKEAHERDDLYAVTNLNLVVGTFVRLAADDPERARREIEQVMSLWSRQGFHVQHMEYLHDQAQIDLYRGDPRSAWKRLNEHWPTLAGSHYFRIQQVRIFMTHLRARAALATAVREADATPYLRAAERDARALEKEKAPWADALARLIRAGVALVRGDARGVMLVREAADCFDAVDMLLYAAAARRLLGRHLGNDEGRSLVARADAWMRERRIQNPARMAALLAPGLPE